jgi:hypothetical protein
LRGHFYPKGVQKLEDNAARKQKVENATRTRRHDSKWPGYYCWDSGGTICNSNVLDVQLGAIMGLNIMCSSCAYSKNQGSSCLAFSSCAHDLDTSLTGPPQRDQRNPDPKNFSVLNAEALGDFVIAKVHYPNCTNYEGTKVLVFHNYTLAEVTNAPMLDPHFCDSDHISPIARFEPSALGEQLARVLCQAMAQAEDDL